MKEIEVLKAITHLENSTTENYQTTEKLTELNTKLMKKNRKLQEKLVAALEKLVTQNKPLNHRRRKRKEKYY